MDMRNHVAAAGLAMLSAGAPCIAAADAGPSFDCTKKLTSSVEQRICADPKLAALDRQMADVYAAATAKATAADAQALALAQRDWIKGRNDCWKSADVPACVETAYRQRIAELQARYRLIAPVGSGRYQCPGTPAREATAEFFETDPPTALVDFAGATQLMFVAPSGSGARYTGGNRQFWEHQGVAMIRWGAGVSEVSCPMRK
jgi:uncharacterized protein